MTDTKIRDKISEMFKATNAADNDLRYIINEVYSDREILDGITVGELKTIKANLTAISEYCTEIAELARTLKFDMDKLV